MTALLITLAILLLLFLFLLFPSRHTEHDTALDVNYAHRGLWDDEVPENSLAAFGKAVEAGYGVELDLQLSSDGEVFVFHDENLSRMTGIDKKLSACSAEELDHIHLGSSDEKIPRLTEVLSLIHGQIPILVELKGETTNTALCPKADAILSRYEGPYCIESFNPLLLRWYRVHRPDIYRGLLYTNLCKDKFSLLGMTLTGMLMNMFCRPQFIAYDKTCKNAPPVRFCTKTAGADRFTWTVRTMDEYSEAQKEHALAIFEQIDPGTQNAQI